MHQTPLKQWRKEYNDLSASIRAVRGIARNHVTVTRDLSKMTVAQAERVIRRANRASSYSQAVLVHLKEQAREKMKQREAVAEYARSLASQKKQVA